MWTAHARSSLEVTSRLSRVRRTRRLGRWVLQADQERDLDRSMVSFRPEALHAA